MYSGYLEKLKEESRIIKELEIPIMAIAAGHNYCAALTKEGKIFILDENKVDYLEKASPLPDISNLSTIKFKKAKFIAIAAGLEHSLALTDKGEVIAWEITLSGNWETGLVQMR